ncbi:MAG: PspA-associated protein PspAA [Acidimicrobiales bacterium]
MGEGQYELADEALASLEEQDRELNTAIEEGDEARFEQALQSLIVSVRTNGTELDAFTLVPSDLTLPHDGSTLEDVKALLASEPAADTIREGA